MKITITGRKVTLKDNFKDLVEKKLSRFDKIFDDDAEAIVTVTLERNRQTVEITIKQRGMIYRAEDTELEMNDALDKVVSALSTQISRNKKKLEKSRKVRSDVSYDELSFEDDDDDDVDEYEVVKTKTFYVKVMTPEEAILQMNMLGHEFFMFRDDATGEINVVYKRDAGDYGLLIPEPM